LPRRSRLPSDKEIEFQLQVRKYDNRSRIITYLGGMIIKYVALAVICYFILLAVRELAGKETIAKFLFLFINDINLKEIVLSVLTIGAILYGLLQRALRRKMIQRFSARCDMLERKINPQKVSSEITKEGKTKIEDKKWL
jgi:hypothetical protein